MQSAKNIQDIETVQVKSEVITIDEDEIQSANSDEIQVQPRLIQHNGGTSKLIYYFEPQQKSDFVISKEDKSKLQLPVSSDTINLIRTISF